MKALGLNPGEQEMIDMTNEVSVNGLIYYPDFCKLVLRKYREENKEVLNQALFKVHKHSHNNIRIGCNFNNSNISDQEEKISFIFQF